MHITWHHRQFPWGAIGGSLLSVVLVVGCGRDSDHLGRVAGKVTLDGQPLPNATVVFSPKTSGSQSLAVTDANGAYALLHSARAPGAEPGEHRVTISTFTSGDPDSKPPVARAAERVPVRYNVRSELNATVQRGQNRIDFDLVGSGPVLQPDSVAARGFLAR